MNTIYISFCGEFIIPTNVEALNKKYLRIENGVQEYYNVNTGDIEVEAYYEEFRKELDYKEIDKENSLTVYLAKINKNTGHLVAELPNADSESTFVVLENEEVKRPTGNFNPNPVRQLL